MCWDVARKMRCKALEQNSTRLLTGQAMDQAAVGCDFEGTPQSPPHWRLPPGCSGVQKGGRKLAGLLRAGDDRLRGRV